MKSRTFKEVAGVKGFEPLNAWTKTRCLTAWRYPNNQAQTKSIEGGIIVVLSNIVNKKNLKV